MLDNYRVLFIIPKNIAVVYASNKIIRINHNRIDLQTVAYSAILG